MKKILAIAVMAAAMFFAGNANAQLSVNAGFANQSKTFTGPQTMIGQYTDRDTSMTGFFIGASYNLSLTENLGVAPGLYYQRLGHGTEHSLLAGTLHTSSVEQAIAIPVMFNYKYSLNNDLAVFGFAGPNFTYGLTKTFTFWLNDSDHSDPSLDYYDGDNPVNSRFNMFVSFGAGVQYHALRLQVGYQLGMMDRTNSDNTTEKVNNLFVGVGYVL